MEMVTQTHTQTHNQEDAIRDAIRVERQVSRPRVKYIYSVVPVLSTLDNGAVMTIRYMPEIVDWYYERINQLWMPERFPEAMKQGLIGFCEGIRHSRNKIYFCCTEPIRSLDSPFARLLIPGEEDCRLVIDTIEYKMGAVELRSEVLRPGYENKYHNKELYQTIY